MIRLKDFPTEAPHKFNKTNSKTALDELQKELFLLQNVLYAEGKHPILIVLQGMDTSGKDGTIRNVFSCVNPMGCNVKSFKAPTPEELRHDFLWRVYPNLPAKGMIQIFNRSHYEDILVPSVTKSHSKNIIERRFGHINIFEKRLAEAGTVILKFFLHISRKEQKRRIQRRLNDPRRQWKYDKSDKAAAKKWDAYHATYEEVLTRCSPEIPWNIVPSDDKWYRNYFIAKTLVAQLRALKLKFPKKAF
ncbi:MAG: PPK2 family polyphosphate kinase [Bacteroidota bacterium]